MRPFLPIGSLLSSLALGAGLTACNDTAYQSWGPPPDVPVGEMVTISGVVTDSLLGGVIPGVRVSSGRYTADADAGGQWSLTVPKGPTSITTSPAGYERLTYSFDALGTVTLDLQVRRLAPAVTECVREGDQVHALVTDLQGRKTIERWAQSQALIDDPAGIYRVGAINWQYEALDYLTWRVTLRPISPDVTRIQWDVYDSDGHRFTGACEPAEAPPHE